MKAGVKNQPVMFLMTDAQVPQEEFLVLINDLLASGEIPGLFADDEVEEVINGVRNEVKATGMEDSRENCWKFFIDRVRRTLKVRVGNCPLAIFQLGVCLYLKSPLRYTFWQIIGKLFLDEIIPDLFSDAHSGESQKKITTYQNVYLSGELR